MNNWDNLTSEVDMMGSSKVTMLLLGFQELQKHSVYMRWYSDVTLTSNVGDTLNHHRTH